MKPKHLALEKKTVISYLPHHEQDYMRFQFLKVYHFIVLTSVVINALFGMV